MGASIRKLETVTHNFHIIARLPKQNRLDLNDNALREDGEGDLI